MIKSFLSEYEELILKVYKVVNPEESCSNFTIEDVYGSENLEDFIYDYMQNEFEDWRSKNDR